MKRKSLMLVLAGLMSAGILAGCGSSTDANAGGGETAETSGDKKIKIGATIYKYDDNFMSYVRRALDKEANGKAELIMNDSQNDQSKQLEQIDTMIAKGVNVLAINLVDPKAAPSVIEKAKKADLPVIFFNKEPEESAMKSYEKCWYVGTESKESGVLQGKLIADAWNANKDAWDKNKDGKMQYVMIKGEIGHPDAEARTKYSVEEIKNAGIEVQELAIDTGMWDAAKATEKMDAWLAKNGDNIEVVICNNDGMALGALASLEKDSKKAAVYGVDAIPEVLDKIKEDKIAGTVLNDAKNQGKAIIEASINVANGKDVVEGTDLKLDDKKAVRVPYVGVNKENVSVGEEAYK